MLHNPGAEYLKRHYVYGPYCKLFKKDIINKNKIRFDLQLSYGEDILFLLEYILHAQNMHVTSYIGYYYVRYTDSLSCRIRTYESMYKMYYKHVDIIEKILNEKINSRRLDEKLYCRNVFSFYRSTKKHTSDLIKDAFFLKCYNKHLNNIDKFVFMYCSHNIIKLYKTFYTKY